jgi:hypothetical protein
MAEKYLACIKEERIQTKAKNNTVLFIYLSNEGGSSLNYVVHINKMVNEW